MENEIKQFLKQKRKEYILKQSTMIRVLIFLQVIHINWSIEPATKRMFLTRYFVLYNPIFYIIFLVQLVVAIIDGIVDIYNSCIDLIKDLVKDEYIAAFRYTTKEDKENENI